MNAVRNSRSKGYFKTMRWSYSPPKNCDPLACTESFKKHWQQASEIMNRTLPPYAPIEDDVLAVMNHVEQMVFLLVGELRPDESSPTECLEHLLSEAILQRLFEWSVHTSRFCHLVTMDQLKLYELLINRAGRSLLVHESFLRPLLTLLTSCAREVFPSHIEKQLVILLNQLCVCVMQNTQMLSLFFSNQTRDSPPSFIIFSLLIKFVHRDGALGQQARDALLLCMSISKQHDALGSFIADHSEICPVLATGLSGLYSVLGRKLEIESEGWHRLTTDDVNELTDLTLFINSVEFCDAVVQVAHKSVREQLLELIHKTFLVQMMGTALLQDSVSYGKSKAPHAGLERLKASTEEEFVASTAYYELILRSSTPGGIQPLLTDFIVLGVHDEKRILNTLIERINSENRLCIVTLSLMETLVSLDSESVMSEMVLKYLTPCSHIMLSQRERLRDSRVFSASAARLLTLTPTICQTNTTQLPPDKVAQPTSVYGLRPEESLYGNYHAYLCDARARIQSCANACQTWRFPYDGASPPALDDDQTTSLGGDSSGYESLVAKGSPGTDMNGVDLNCSPQNGVLKPHDLTDEEELCQRLSDQDKSMQRFAVGGVTKPDIGPFLDAILHKVETMPNQSLHVNLRLSSIISRLTVYPQPLLCSTLLNHSLVCQPSVRSLPQVLRSLKQSLDRSLIKSNDLDDMVSDARQYFLQREKQLASMRRSAVEGPVVRRTESFSRGDSKRRSLTSAVTSLLRRAMPSTDQLVENEVSGTGYRYIRGRDTDMWNRVLCALLLEEWLKELAAIAQEHQLHAEGCTE